MYLYFCQALTIKNHLSMKTFCLSVFCLFSASLYSQSEWDYVTSSNDSSDWYVKDIKKIKNTSSDDFDFWVKIGSKSFAVIASIAIDYIKVVHLIEVVFGCISRKHRGYSRVESATEYGSKPCLTESVLVSPLPRILEMSLIFGFVIGSIQIVYTTF